MVKVSKKQIREKVRDCMFSTHTDPLMNIVAEVGNAEYSIRRAIENLMTDQCDESIRQTISILLLARVQIEAEAIQEEAGTGS